VFIKFTRGSRKHRIGRAHAKYVLDNGSNGDSGDGISRREARLDHVMPTQYRTGGRSE
jgi:hypothetical protein